MFSYIRVLIALFVASFTSAHVVSAHGLSKDFEREKSAAKLKKLRMGRSRPRPSPSSGGGSSGGTNAPFSDASVEGAYALIGTGGNHEESLLALVEFDGAGDVSHGIIKLNAPNLASPPDRTIFESPLEGTYAIEADGDGSALLESFPPGGGTFPFNLALQITERVGPSAATISANSESNPAGTLIKFEMVRRGASGGFDETSVSGAYSIVLRVGADEGTAIGRLDFDGAGGITGTLEVNDPDSADPTARKLFTTPITGTYSVEDHGFGSAVMTYVAFGLTFDVDFLITQEGGLHAHHINLFFQQLSPNIQGLVTGEMIFLGNDAAAAASEF